MFDGSKRYDFYVKYCKKAFRLCDLILLLGATGSRKRLTIHTTVSKIFKISLFDIIDFTNQNIQIILLICYMICPIISESDT